MASALQNIRQRVRDKVNSFKPMSATEEILAQPAAVPDPSMAVQPVASAPPLETTTVQPQTATQELLAPPVEAAPKQVAPQQVAATVPESQPMAAEPIPETIQFGSPGGVGSGSFQTTTTPVTIEGVGDVGKLWNPPEGLNEQQMQQWNQGNVAAQQQIQGLQDNYNKFLEMVNNIALDKGIAEQMTQQAQAQLKQQVQGVIGNVQRNQQNMMQFNQMQSTAGGGTTTPPEFEGIDKGQGSVTDQLLNMDNPDQQGSTGQSDSGGTPARGEVEKVQEGVERGNVDKVQEGVERGEVEKISDTGGGVVTPEPEEDITAPVEAEAGVNVDAGTQAEPAQVDTSEVTDEAGQAEPETTAGTLSGLMTELGDLASTANLDFADAESLGQNETVQKFIDNLLTSDPELSEEEKNVIRMNTQKGMQAALSQLSARGLGRGSDAARTIIQGNIMAEYEIAREQGRVRSERVQQALQAAGIEAGRESQRASNVFTFEGQDIQRDVANQNFLMAIQNQRLDEVKNAQGFSLEQRALDQKDELLSLDRDKFNEAVREFGAEFGLAIDAESFRQALETGQFNLNVIDSDRTYDLRNRQMLQEKLLTMRDQDIQEALGISKLELEAWAKGEDVKIDTMANMLNHLAIQNNYDISMAEIQIELAKLQGEAEGGKKGVFDFFADLAPYALMFL